MKSMAIRQAAAKKLEAATTMPEILIQLLTSEGVACGGSDSVSLANSFSLNRRLPAVLLRWFGMRRALFWLHQPQPPCMKSE
jgi:hypothetical protein